MREPEELATGPDYRWRRLWNQFWMHACVVVFLLTALVVQEFFLIPLIVTAVFYFAVSRKVKELDAAARGSTSSSLDDIIETALQRHREEERTNPDLTASGIPRVSDEDHPAASSPPPPVPEARPQPTTFGRAKTPPRKPVDLPRHRP